MLNVTAWAKRVPVNLNTRSKNSIIMNREVDASFRISGYIPNSLSTWTHNHIHTYIVYVTLSSVLSLAVSSGRYSGNCKMHIDYYGIECPYDVLCMYF